MVIDTGLFTIIVDCVVGFIWLAIFICYIIDFIKAKKQNLPTNAEINNLKEWLLYAVTAAEKEFGARTGKIKLRFVYDLALEKFPKIVGLINFATFSNMVDETLETFDELLTNSLELQEYIEGDGRNE